MVLDKERRRQYTQKVEENFPEELILPCLNKRLSLRYGMNPGTPAAFYIEEGAFGNMSDFEILQEGKGLGYINIADMDLGQRIIRLIHELDSRYTSCCIVKHEIPSAAARGKNTYESFVDAWGSNPLSSFGGVHVFSGKVEEDLAELLIDPTRNTEVIYAPEFSNDALKILARRELLRLVKMSDLNQLPKDNGLEYKRLGGAMLVEIRQNTKIRTKSDLECISQRKPSEKEINSVIFNWAVAYYTRSNAIVIGTENKTHGIGSGQTSRIDSAYMAIRIANGRDGTNPSYGSKGTFMASDGFLPSTDVVELASKNGITGIIFPLGSIKDNEVIKCADENNLVLLATRKLGTHDSERGFTHR